MELLPYHGKSVESPLHLNNLPHNIGITDGTSSGIGLVQTIVGIGNSFVNMAIKGNTHYNFFFWESGIYPGINTGIQAYRFIRSGIAIQRSIKIRIGFPVLLR